MFKKTLYIKFDTIKREISLKKSIDYEVVLLIPVSCLKILLTI